MIWNAGAVQTMDSRHPRQFPARDPVSGFRRALTLSPSVIPTDPVHSSVASETNSLEMEKLCAFIRKAAQLDPCARPGPQLVVLAQSIFELESAAIFDADLREVYRVGEWSDNLEDLLQNIYIFEMAGNDLETGLVRRVLQIGNLPIGAMLLRGETSAWIANVIASLVAITFDRYHAFANESRTERARQTEQLRTTVLDSLAHEYKTPLTVIEAASSGLSAMGNLTSAQAELVTLIDEQAKLLTQLTTRLLKTARLEASDLVPHPESILIAPLIEDVVASLREQLASVRVQITISHDNLLIHCDRNLLVALLTQYVDNAGKYANAGTTVTIRAAEDANDIVFSVHSFGPVIQLADYERIFDRYYRCSISDNKAPGTGIGLSVARRAVQAQGGHVWVTSDTRKGTTFYASLPITPHEGARS